MKLFLRIIGYAFLYLMTCAAINFSVWFVTHNADTAGWIIAGYIVFTIASGIFILSSDISKEREKIKNIRNEFYAMVGQSSNVKVQNLLSDAADVCSDLLGEKRKYR